MKVVVLILVWIPFVDWVLKVDNDAIVIIRLVAFAWVIVDVGVVAMALVKTSVED